MPVLHPKVKKRWRNWLTRLAMVCFIVPLVKLIAFFRVQHPRVLKLNTSEEQVAEYLRLEYGEVAEDPDSLQASDLSYLGRFNVDGYPTDYWQYPTSDQPAYATMTMRDGTTELSMTDEPPSGEV
jgi:hypothetical protein